MQTKMNKLLFVTLIGFCYILVAESQEDAHAEWQNNMENMYCGNDADAKMKFKTCVEGTPEAIVDLVMEKTESPDFYTGLDKLCADKEKAEEICKAVQESGDQMGMTPEKMRGMLDCMKN